MVCTDGLSMLHVQTLEMREREREREGLEAFFLSLRFGFGIWEMFTRYHSHFFLKSSRDTNICCTATLIIDLYTYLHVINKQRLEHATKHKLPIPRPSADPSRSAILSLSSRPATCILNHEIANLPRSRDTCLVTVIIIISPHSRK